MRLESIMQSVLRRGSSEKNHPKKNKKKYGLEKVICYERLEMFNKLVLQKETSQVLFLWKVYILYEEKIQRTKI